jgi:uncharacterized protein
MAGRRPTKFERLLPLARKGDPYAQNYIGYCHSVGYGVPKSVQLAARWFKKAVKGGDTTAAYNLALQSSPRAEYKLYRIGAEVGDAKCQNNLGVMYSEGIGTKRNFRKAIEYWRLAAAQGDSKAEFNLGQAYINGEGVLANRKIAKTWLARAHQHGNRKATALLKQIRNS